MRLAGISEQLAAISAQKATQDKETIEAQDATRDRDAKLKILDEWMSG